MENYCLWTSRGSEDMPGSKNSAGMSCDPLEFDSSQGNLWFSCLYNNTGSNWTNAAIHQMHCVANG